MPATPTITRDTLAQYTLHFETEACSRCDGTGRYSYNAMHGDTCFKCGGGKVQHTRRGAAARKAYDAERARLMNVELADVMPGDRIMLAVYPYAKRWRTVDVVAHDVKSSGREKIGSEDWKDIPPYVWISVTVKGQSHRVAMPRTTMVERYDAELVMQVWRRTLRLSGASLQPRKAA